mmetsp:Transcript_58549/g.139374  ORF Transcript_58549/g.139374 Transcript_58549/m.139374 type:complete len:274 (-) Transcript_58549:420-1241(-)
MHLRIAQQGQRAVGQGESTLVQVHALGVLLLDLFLRLGCDLHLGTQSLGDGVERRQVADVGLPEGLVEDAHVGGACGQGGNMRQLGVEDVSGACAATEGLRHLLLGILELHLLKRLGTFSGSLLKGLVGLLSHTSCFRIGDLLRSALDQRLELRHQRQHLCRVLDELAHVVHDQAARALHLLVLVIQAARQHGHGDRQSRGFHVLHENASGKFLHAGMGLVDGGGCVHHGRQEGLQVLVAGAAANGGHALKCCSLHLLLDVAGQISHGGHQVH